MNGVHVLAQHLPDTEIQAIDLARSITIASATRLDVALMQGFLTLPFIEERVPDPFICNYSDIIGYRLFDGQHSFENTQDGVMLNHDGRFTQIVSVEEQCMRWVNLERIAGVGDSHTGLDYLVPFGNLIVSGAPTGRVWYPIPGDSGTIELLVDVTDADGQTLFDNCYGHLDVSLVQSEQRVYRGQVVGLSGDDRRNPTSCHAPLPHYHVGRCVPSQRGCGWWYLDPYGYTVHLDPLPNNFWGSEVSWWTKDNDPQFPLVSLGD